MQRKQEYDLDKDGVLDERELELAMEKEAKSRWISVNRWFHTHPPTFQRVLLLREIQKEMGNGRYTTEHAYAHGADLPLSGLDAQSDLEALGALELVERAAGVAQGSDGSSAWHHWHSNTTFRRDRLAGSTQPTTTTPTPGISDTMEPGLDCFCGLHMARLSIDACGPDN